uniref:Formin like 1 n=1 Tax=Sparus aurata TaxID=8175 RepID=A0A671Y531_SPAAU
MVPTDNHQYIHVNTESSALPAGSCPPFCFTRKLHLWFDLNTSHMNLPPDKLKLLSQYDNEKKWELVCDQERFQVKSPPSTYLAKIKSLYQDQGGVSRRVSLKKRIQDATQVLKDLEISLRTNHIGWAQEFLNEQNKGLDVLVEYLSHAQSDVSFEVESVENGGTLSDKSKPAERSMEDLTSAKSYSSSHSHGMTRAMHKRSHSSYQRDDVHVCIMCLRAIMNYQSGFNLVMTHPRCVNEITLSLNSRNPRTKALVLELLAAVCLVRGGHDIILSAFDNFKDVSRERNRFEKLMEYFINDDSNIDFMVACMQFINIVVHSVENMNFRVHLQYEFTHLSLDKYLEVSVSTESEKLQVQIQAYLDNVLDVGALLEDAENRGGMLLHVDDLQEHNVQGKLLLLRLLLLLHLYQEPVEFLHLLHLHLPHLVLDLHLHLPRRVLDPHLHLPRLVLDPHLHLPHLVVDLHLPLVVDLHLLLVHQALVRGLTEESECVETVNILFVRRFIPFFSAISGLKSKKPIQTKYRLPLLNWQALKPNQVTGTVFNELDDEQVLGELNMDMFEDMFKTRAQGPPADLSSVKKKVAQKTPSKISLIDPNKAKNLAITLRKGGMNPSAICTAIETYDQQSLSIDFLELLEAFIPSDYELKLLVNYEKDGRPLDELTNEDQFILQFGKIKRLKQRINTLTFMGNFPETVKRIQPQLNSIIAASMSIKSSDKLKKILEIVLAFGNYMNSSKRGAAYGFRLQSLDLLLETKSTDRSQTLLQFITSIIQEKYPDLVNFHTDLHFVDKAALVSLDGILQDIRSLERGMEVTKKEFMVQDDSPVLKEFIKVNCEQLEALIKDSKTAQEAYGSVVEYFGENPKTTQPSMFFPLFGRFIKGYKGPMMPKMPQMDLIAELKKRQKPQVREGKDGALEDIITGTVTGTFTRGVTL